MPKATIFTRIAATRRAHKHWDNVKKLQLILLAEMKWHVLFRELPPRPQKHQYWVPKCPRIFHSHFIPTHIHPGELKTHVYTNTSTDVKGITIYNKPKSRNNPNPLVNEKTSKI